jgi:hypothetical protein
LPSNSLLFVEQDLLVHRVVMKLDRVLAVLSLFRQEKDRMDYKSQNPLVGRERNIDYANEVAVIVLRSGRVEVGSTSLWCVWWSMRPERSLGH